MADDSETSLGESCAVGAAQAAPELDPEGLAEPTAAVELVPSSRRILGTAEGLKVPLRDYRCSIYPD